MGLVRLRLFAKGMGRKVSAMKENRKPLTISQARCLLMSLQHHTKGRPFGVQAWRAWLRGKLRSSLFSIPSVEECGRLLQKLAQGRKLVDEEGSPVGAWKFNGLRYQHEGGNRHVSDLEGYEQSSRGPSRAPVISWHEYGKVYRLNRSTRPGTFHVTCSKAFKRLGCTIQKQTLQVNMGPKTAEFKSSVIISPRITRPSNMPQWTMIYLHSFSNKAVEYLDFPHYFAVGGAALRVVLPTAPFVEQSCFKDWMVWRGKRLRWRRIRFNSWFDYLTDKGGSGENHLCLESLLAMRSQLHALIRQEVQRVGGDPRRVILGGASQGCCVALDAAMTYPDELGGVIGLVGHILGSTPLDPSKRKMPIHLFHEESDREMRWEWVKETVRRLAGAGFNVTSKRELDPSGKGHWIQDIEGEWIREALRKIIFGHA